MLFSKFATTMIATKTNSFLVFCCRNIVLQPKAQLFRNKPVFNLFVFERNLSRCSLPPKQSLALCYDDKRERENNESNKSWIGGPATFIAALIPVINEKEEDKVEKKVKETKPRERFNFIADVVEMVIPSIVQIGIKTPTYYGQVDAASGSGFIVSSDGLILTNAHVVRNYINDINVKLNDGRSFNGRVIKIDKSADLAIIKIDCNNLKQVKLGDSEKVRTGEFVIALGSPLSLNNTVTSGVVSNPNRDGTELGLTNKLSYLQTDTIVTHGNSGGPLINLDGEVIGINTMTAAPGISFAIPSKYANEFLNTKTSSIASKYRYLGMKMISLTPQIFYLFNSQPSSDIHLPEMLRQGCLVVDVAPNSPADRSGLKRGDVIIGANEHPIAKNADLFDILRNTPELRLIVIRENVELRITVKADEKEG